MTDREPDGLSRREFLMVTAAGATALKAGAVPEAPKAPPTTDEHVPLHPSRRAWQARWIWYQKPVGEKNCFVLFRKSFQMEQAAQAATALITADSRYKLYVNGQYVGRGPVRYKPSHIFFDQYDVAPHLTPGKNTIAVVAHFLGVPTEQYLVGTEGFLFELTVKAATGKEFTVASNETWKAFRATAWNSKSPREFWCQGFVEILDFRQLPKDWINAEFDDSTWGPCFVIGPPPQEPWTNLVPRLIPQLVEKPTRPRLLLRIGEVQDSPPAEYGMVGPQMQAETILPMETVQIQNPEHLLDGSGQPTLIVTPQAGRSATIILDFGREVAAMPALEVEGVDGAEVDIGFSEVLRDGKPVVVRKVATFPPSKTADRLILRDGLQSWERFFYTGFRYMQFTFRKCQKPVKIHYAGATLTHYPFEDRGYFRCSDPLLTQVWEVGRYTTMCCTSDVYVDCPWREKGQWVEMVTPLVSHVCFGAREVADQYLRTLAISQDSEGRLWIPYPSSWYTEIPDQSMWWGMHLWQYFLYFGDRSTLEDLDPAFTKAAAWFDKHVEPPGLISTRNWDTPILFMQKAVRPYVWIDWGWQQTYAKVPLLQRYGQSAALNCIYYQFLLDAAKIVNVLGRRAEAVEYEEKARKLKQAINQTYWSEQEGFYYEDLSHKLRGGQASILAVLYEIAPQEQWARICKTIVNDKYEAGDSSPHFYLFVLEALKKAGQFDRALEAMRVRYGNMLARGATTWWEAWNVDVNSALFVPETWSYCHAYSAGPTFTLSTAVLGVCPTGPGFSTFSVQPQTADLDWAEGTMPTPAGPISVAWHKEAAGQLTISIGVPEKTKASVRLPFLPGAKGLLRCGNVVLYQHGSPVAQLRGIENVRAIPEAVEFTASPGAYLFTTE